MRIEHGPPLKSVGIHWVQCSEYVLGFAEFRDLMPANSPYTIAGGTRKWKWKSLSRVRLFATLWVDSTAHGILQVRIQDEVAVSFSRGSYRSRDQTQVSCITGRFFISWATRQAQECWCGKPIPSPADFPDPGIELGSPALQADSLPIELSGKLIRNIWDLNPDKLNLVARDYLLYSFLFPL